MDPDGADRRVICKVCLRQYARYTCPRCNLAYCSLPCYKQHGEQCTESFYRDQALGELQGRTADGEQRRKVLDILARQQQQQLEDEEMQAQLLSGVGGMKLREAGGQQGEAEEELEEEGEEEEEEDGEEGEEEEEGLGGPGAAMLSALGGVLSEATLERLLHKAASRPSDEWEVEEEDLTPEEWRAFQRAVALGKLGDAPSAGTRSTGGAGITPGAAASGSFTPWWELQEARELTLGPTGQRLVVELREAALAAATAAAVLLPAAPEAPLPPLSSLTKAAPSPLLAWHLLEVLFAYCYTVRRFRGSWAGQEGSAAAVMLALTDVLAAAAAGSRGGRGQGGGGGGEAEEEGGAARLPETAAQACLHVLERACGPPVGTAQDRAYAVAVLYDTAVLLQNGRANVVLALADAHRLVRSALAPPTAPASTLAEPTSGATAAAVAGASKVSSSAVTRPGTSPAHQGRVGTAGQGAGAHVAAAGATGRTKAGAGAGAGLSKAQRAQLGAVERKLFFLSVWANGLGEEEVEQVGAAVMGEWGVQHDAVAAGRGGRGRVVTR